jgi:hypothetical protein
MTKSGISAGLQSIKVSPGNLCLEEVMLANAEGALVFKVIDMDMADLTLLYTWCMEC